MIASLTGNVSSIFKDSIIIDVNGVGYKVFVASTTIDYLNVGEQTKLITITVHKEDTFCLYGFKDKFDQECFEVLNSVQGVGYKVCLAMQSTFSSKDLCQLIINEDSKSLCLASGVGPKLAKRIISELKNKVVKIIQDTPSTQNKQNTDVLIIEDSISALVNLGYSRLDAMNVVNKVIAQSPNKKVTEIITLALSELSVVK